MHSLASSDFRMWQLNSNSLNATVGPKTIEQTKGMPTHGKSPIQLLSKGRPSFFLEPSIFVVLLQTN